MVTLPNFRFSIQLDSLFFIQLVKNFRFGPKIRFLGLNPKFFLESSSSVDQADPGLQTEPIDIFDFFSTFLPRNAHIWPKKRFLRFKQQWWTTKSNETKIHPTSPRHLYSKKDIGIFYFLIIIKGCLYRTGVFVWLTFGQFVKHCFWCFSKHFWVTGKCLLL